MIRKRRANRDDALIYFLIKKELIPLGSNAISRVQFNKKTMRKRIQNMSTFVVSSGKSLKPYGFVSCLIRENEFVVDMLAVKKSYQGKGAGTALMDKAERLAKTKGFSKVYLFVDKGNSGGQRFYERRGYYSVRLIPEVQCYLLAKDLF
jgi:ribosomal protein S18 acetylase RimI-like enzyme